MNCSFIKPKSMEEGLKVLSDNRGDLKILAGGSDLINRLKKGKVTAKALLDVSNLHIEYIRGQDNLMTIGAMTRLSTIEGSLQLECEPYSILRESAGQVGGWQTRNLATIGGNICTGNSCADMAVTLLVLGAKLKLLSLEGERIIPADKFFIAPRKVNVKNNEILTEIIIDNFDKLRGVGTSFIKFGKRKSNCIAVINVAVLMALDDEGQNIKTVRIAMGTVAPIPIRLYKTERFLVENKVYSQRNLQEAIEIMKNEISPRTSLRAGKEFREEIAKVLLNRAIKISMGKIISRGNKRNDY